ncbi:MAG: glycoside hydrolase family 95 protein [Chitinispirillaceae bacterium]|jgi:hypothetical protein|nr:glycoside hydrolase family 95 protein [Chitinispirillaceae bacterium]
MNEVLRRDFPISRPEIGLLLANGTIGAMIWGRENTLCITLNRSDFWYHKGGTVLSADATIENLKALVAADETDRCAALLENAKNGTSAAHRPTLLPLGRIDLVFSKDTVFKTGYLHLKNGKVVIDITDKNGSYQVSCYLAMDKPLINIHFPQNRDVPKVNCVTAWDCSAGALEALGLERPAMIEEPTLRGWVQKRPGDPPLCVGASSDKSDVFIVLRYGDSPEAAKDRVRKMADKARKAGSDALRGASAAFWANHWRWVPHIDIPSEPLSFLYYYGTYMFASLTTPGGVVPSIYGPWIDENGEPPFTGGYHGFINLCMCYWPAFRANLLQNCKSLFTMVESWSDRMRDNGRRVFGIDNGVLLPCAVDDRCMRIGGTYADIADPGSACLVAELMYRYYQYSQDHEFLRTTAYPFMLSVMSVYDKLLEKDRETWSLPFSVSPVFRGTTGALTGKNASFQLACVHFLCESLQAAAQALGEQPDRRWARIAAGLPRFAECEGRDASGRPQREIGVFEGVALDESEALHSHLVGLSPLDTLDPDDKHVAHLLEETIESWVYQGMGAWNSASLPWASMIHTRINNADMAELLLEIWERVFTNEGWAAVRDPLFMGFSTRGTPESAVAGKNEILHMDACMGATAAIMEMLLHTRRGVNHLFCGAPQRWKYVSFDNIRTEGAFEVGATRRGTSVVRVTVKANAPGTFRLANPFTSNSGRVAIQRARGTSVQQGQILEIPMQADERVELTEE